MNRFTALLLVPLAACTTGLASSDGDGASATASTEQAVGVQKFSFSVNGLEHGNGAL